MHSSHSLNRESSNVYMEVDQNNPETAFAKLMSIPEDVPLRECKMLLDTMKEQSLFEKAIISNTHRQRIPNHVKIERAKSQSFRNYQKLLTYTKKKKDLQDFERKSLGKMRVKIKRNRAQTLQDFVNETKVKMLTQNSKYNHNDRVIESILSNDKAREQLFDESILIERLHYVRRKQLKCEEETSKIPAKFKGLDPKHLRIPESCRQESSFHRRKYIHHQKTFQYFKNAIKTEKNMLKTKQKQNGLVIKHLMNNFSEQILNSKNDHAVSTQKCINRLFLKYANSDSEDINNMFKYISKERTFNFFEDFSIEYKHNQAIIQIINSKQINEFYFLQILHILSLKEGNKFQSDIKAFIDTVILTQRRVYLPHQWNLYEQNKAYIGKHMKIRRFKQKLQFLHENLLNKERQREGAVLMGYNFDQMVEIMWMLKIYPFMISKKKLRFFYLYTQSSHVGISINDIADIYIYVALSRQGDVIENINEIVGMVAEYNRNKKQQ